jgi:hypothetical protein
MIDLIGESEDYMSKMKEKSGVHLKTDEWGKCFKFHIVSYLIFPSSQFCILFHTVL